MEFLATVRSSGGSVEITIDSKIAELEKIEAGDIVTVEVKKVNRKC